ncbi:MAG TPA: formate dehydrogenase subunit delta [Micropepsaceae bacterium]|nr:formate dehydrogenase subunit delta [Micropepsaceae bacterium]
MSSTTVKTLVHQANQIADFFRLQPEAEAITNTADHIRRFWDPRMRAQMAEHIGHGGAGLNAIARPAAERACKAAAPAKEIKKLA